MRRTFLVAAVIPVGLVAGLVAALGCKDNGKPKAEPAPPQNADPHGSLRADAGPPPPPTDWVACEAAVTKAASAELAARPQILIDGCHVCGDWAPILRWNTPTPAGGPKRVEIEHAMDACGAFCLGDARLKFLGTLDDARGRSSRMPWKQLAVLCKERVSAVPDGRFVDAPYFALDRIARAVGARGGDLATRVAAIDLPLPAVSIIGTGPPLPVLAAGVSAKVSELQITVLAGTIMVGRTPRARLAADGINVDLGSDGYPGKLVTLAELGAALTALGGDKTKTVTILAPHPSPAQALVPVIAAAAKVMPVLLGARAGESPVGWELPGAVPIALDANPANAVRVTAETTVQLLADELAKRVAQKANRVGIIGR